MVMAWPFFRSGCGSNGGTRNSTERLYFTKRVQTSAAKTLGGYQAGNLDLLSIRETEFSLSADNKMFRANLIELESLLQVAVILF